jgi:hypothetical protein
MSASVPITSQEPRALFPREQMQLPHSSTPRPGDAVVWYIDARRVAGQYLGHAAESKPVVSTPFGNQSKLPSFDCLRIRDPITRIGPNWQYLQGDCLIKPFDYEEDRFSELLKQRIPPGPTYLELIEEIWHRGYEVYIVGGTVRDVVAGDQSNDVDIVTTMPISKFELLLQSMFKKLISVHEVRGFARLGGKGYEGDPFIDLKLFCHGGTGTPDALFGSDFTLDISLRDFACNSVYYDPINKALIDPSSRGLNDAVSRTLSLVCDPQARSPEELGQVAIRYFKFCMRGYVGEPDSNKTLADHFIPCLSTLTASHRLSYLNRQIFGKIPKDKYLDAVKSLESTMIASGHEKIWLDLFEPILPKIIKS